MSNRQGSELQILKKMQELLEQYIHLRESASEEGGLAAEESEFYRALVQNSMSDMVILDVNCNIKYVNPHVEESTGYTLEELKDRDITELVHPDHRPSMQEKFSRLVSSHGNTVSFFEFQIRHRNGSYRVFEGIGKNLIQDDQVDGILINAQEITERKQVGQAMLQSQKMEALGLIAGGIAHDFRNIMAIILGAAEMLQMDPSDEEFEKFLNMIISSVHRGNAITERILEFARAEKPKVQALSGTDYLEKIKEIATHTLPKNIEVEVISQREDDLLLGDPGQLQQVLLNLCINASDAMPEGGKITLSLEEPPRKLVRKYRPHARNEYLCLKVEDTGVGMDEEVQERMFEPFFTTKEGGDGTGLGLATVYSIVQQHNGWIDVQSEVGEGTTIRVGIPKAAEANGSVEETQPSLTEEQPDGETILLVEDEPELRELIMHLLTTKGYSVSVATDGKEAIDIYDNDPGAIGLILTDLKMPEMSGNELEEYIHNRDPSMKMVAITGSLGLQSDRDLTREGFDEVIEKPFEVLDVLRIINKVFTAEHSH